jgi:hypothetical protein
MMRSGTAASRDSISEIRKALGARLRGRRREIEQAIETRFYAVTDPREATDPEYAGDLRAAVSAAMEYGLAGIERGEEYGPRIPATLLAQARVAARNDVNLDTMLRRYFAGYALLGDFMVEEVERGDLPIGVDLKRLLRDQATLFDRLLAAVSEEHGRERGDRLATAEERRADRIRRLLDGEMIDLSELSYDFDAHHVGVVAAGPDAASEMRKLAASLDRRLLLACAADGVLWAWFGGRRRSGPEELEDLASRSLPPHITLAIGEPAEGIRGWRLTHRQARVALPIALRSTKPIVRYAGVALIASMLQDDLLAVSLQDIYLAPLGGRRGDGEVLRETLRAFFTADRKISSAAAALEVDRRTVANRLRVIEGKLGRPLRAVSAELEAALRLDSLYFTPAGEGPPYRLPTAVLPKFPAPHAG